jgi:hypothetical protein
MTYLSQRAADLFVERFALPEDYVKTQAKSGWMPTSAGNYAPDVSCFATFCRVEEDYGSVELDPSGWADNILNVRELRVVLTRKVVESE